jgi:hypothetical protein
MVSDLSPGVGTRLIAPADPQMSDLLPRVGARLIALADPLTVECCFTA